MLAVRKNYLGLLVAGAMLFLIALGSAHAQAPGATSARAAEHSLQLYNTHTNEKIDVVYRRGDQYIQGALSKLDYFLRDHNTNEVRHFDPRLYDILSDLTGWGGGRGGGFDFVAGRGQIR